MIDQDLARRAVACKGWRWMPGMRVLLDAQVQRPVRLASAQWMVVEETGRRISFEPMADDTPDFRDPATRGCLLELVREAWGDDAMFAVRIVCIPGYAHLWRIRTGAGFDLPAACVEGPTEAEALVAAFEAAGRK